MENWKAKIYNNNQKIIQVSGHTPQDVLGKLNKSVNEKDERRKQP